MNEEEKLKELEARIAVLEQEQAKLMKHFFPPPPPRIIDLPAETKEKSLKELGLTERSLLILAANNFHKLGDFAGMSRNDLFKIKPFGVKLLRDLEDMVERLGVEFHYPG